MLAVICLAVLYLSFYPAAGVQAANSLTEQKVQEVGQTPDLVIKTAEDLKNFASKVNGGTGYAGRVVVLDNDIAFNGKVSNNFSSIGDEKHPFNGTFDGRGHTISGLNLMTEYDPALFGCVGSGGLVKNVVVKDSVFQGTNSRVGSSYTGGIAARNYGTIRNCALTGSQS